MDLNEERGKQAASTLANTTFHKTDVNEYRELGATFKSVFVSSGNRLDFVFSNAGVIERKNFYTQHTDGIDPPPEFEQLAIDINLRAMISTSYLALHYFRLSPEKGKGTSLVMTSSCGGLYPSYYSPIYTASKCELQIPSELHFASLFSISELINRLFAQLVWSGSCEPSQDISTWMVSAPMPSARGLCQQIWSTKMGGQISLRNFSRLSK